MSLANQANGFTAQVQAGTLRVSTGPDTWDMALVGLGYGGAVQPVGTAQTSTNGNQVDCNYGTIDEWYVNGPGGLEQGFNVTLLPQSEATGSLTVELALGGTLTGAVNAGGNGLTLTRLDGSAALGYTGLTACDATGKTLPASLEVQTEGSRQILMIHVNTVGAQGQITIDPFVQQAELTASDGARNDYFGNSVAISGNTIVIGAPYAAVGGETNVGRAYVFTEPASGWASGMTQKAELTASDGAADSLFGSSVSISGGTVVVGAAWAMVGSNNQGAAYVFTEPASGWANMTQTAKLTASDGAADDFGQSVSISVGTVVVGADWTTVGSNSYQGAAYVFTEPASGWTNMTQTAKLTASDGAPYDRFGYSVSTSGNTVVVGSPGPLSTAYAGNSSPGAVYVFAEPGSGWATMTQTAKLTASDGAARDAFGDSVSISGSTVAVGAGQYSQGRCTGPGAAYVFTEPGSGWVTMTQTAKLTASDGTANAVFGDSVSISGNTVVAGEAYTSSGANGEQGAAYVFTEPSSGWVTMTQTAKLTAFDDLGGDGFGWSVSISGGTVVVGASATKVNANYDQGMAYVFVTVAALQTLYSFPTGDYPRGIAVDGAGNLYGTTEYGGDTGTGTVWEQARGSSTVNSLYSFLGQPLPYFPIDITIDNVGNLYGVSSSGGADGWGSVWELAKGSSTPVTLYSFSEYNVGERPFGIAVDGSGNLYGTGYGGGANDASTVWELAKGGSSITTLYTFADSDDWASGPITVDSNGNLYGTTSGGDNNASAVWELVKGSGTFTLTTLHSFSSEQYLEGIAIDSGGNLYGTTEYGGTCNDGTVWKLAKGSSTLSILCNFTGGADGANPQGLAIDEDDNLYGCCGSDGATAPGTIFELAAARADSLGVYSGGYWYFNVNGTTKIVAAPASWASATPVTGDWNGTGKTDIGLFNNATATWWLDYTGDGVFKTSETFAFGFGGSGVMPVVGDWNGAGKTEVGVYANGAWFRDVDGSHTWDATNQAALAYLGWNDGGTHTVIPVPGHWAGDGKTEMGVYCQGVWFLDSTDSNKWDGGHTYWGWSGSLIPVVGNWSGNGTKSQLGVYNQGVWFLDYDNTHTWDAANQAALAYYGWSGRSPWWATGSTTRAPLLGCHCLPRQRRATCRRQGPLRYGPGRRFGHRSLRQHPPAAMRRRARGI